MKIFLIFVIFSRAYDVKPSRLHGIEIGRAFGLNIQTSGIYFMVESHKCTDNIHSVYYVVLCLLPNS